MIFSNIQRTPEPESVTESVGAVEDYLKATDTAMNSVYVFFLNQILKMTTPSQRNNLLELCSGPGHLSFMLTHGFSEVTGVDLSLPMVNASNMLNELGEHREKCQFIHGDILKTSKLFKNKEKFSCIFFANGAHHLPNLNDVTQSIIESEKVLEDDGLFVIADPIRPPWKWLAKTYIKTIGKEYKKKGLYNFYTDFHNSVYASWNKEELISSIPLNTNLNWFYHSPPVLIPTFQFLVGTRDSRSNLYVSKGLEEIKRKQLLKNQNYGAWRILNSGFAMTKFNKIKTKRRSYEH